MKSGEMNGPYLLSDIDEGWDRRKFIMGLGVAVLTVQSLSLIGCASGSSPNDGKRDANTLITHSSPGTFSHVHDLLIPYAVLNAPPVQGVTFQTTQAWLHRHAIMLTQDELATVGKGGTVTKKANSHIFVIALANRQVQNESGSPRFLTEDRASGAAVPTLG